MVLLAPITASIVAYRAVSTAARGEVVFLLGDFGSPLGKLGLPNGFWHLSNGFSGLAKGLLRSANDGSSLAKDILSIARDILGLAKGTFGSARDIWQISNGFSGLSNGFWDLSKGKRVSRAKERVLAVFNHVVVACLWNATATPTFFLFVFQRRATPSNISTPKPRAAEKQKEDHQEARHSVNRQPVTGLENHIGLVGLIFIRLG
jgi:hypothetical protein